MNIILLIRNHKPILAFLFINLMLQKICYARI